jgi:hypothetical protein
LKKLVLAGFVFIFLIAALFAGSVGNTPVAGSFSLPDKSAYNHNNKFVIY